MKTKSTYALVKKSNASRFINRLNKLNAERYTRWVDKKSGDIKITYTVPRKPHEADGPPHREEVQYQFIPFDPKGCLSLTHITRTNLTRKGEPRSTRLFSAP